MNSKLSELAEKVSRELDKADNIHCISHYDTDGIASAAISHRALDRAGKKFEMTFVKDLTEEKIEKLNELKEETILFTDIGSGQADKIQEKQNKNVIISDHHEPSAETSYPHLNPHLVDIDGSSDISGAGVTYLLMKSLDDSNSDSINLALVGAVGDIQKDGDQFSGINKHFVEEAKEKGLLEVKKGLRLYGRNGKTLPRALSLTTSPFLPGISNNESGAVQFLSELGIDLKEDGEWRSLSDLTLEEESKIVNKLLKCGIRADGLIGDVYILDNGWEISEFSSLLNACGRLRREEDGLKICLENDFKVAKKVKRSYGRKISKYLNFLEDNLENPEHFHELGEAAIINAKNEIDDKMIGTITTIAIKSGIVEKNILVGVAYADNDKIKISGRTTDEMCEKGFKINDMISEIAEECDGEGGGHKIAAGGKIPRSEEERFIKLLTEVLKKKGEKYG